MQKNLHHMQNILRINFAGKVLRCFAGSWLFYTKKQKTFGRLNKFTDEKLTDSPENLQNAENCLLERVHRKKRRNTRFYGEYAQFSAGKIVHNK